MKNAYIVTGVFNHSHAKANAGFTLIELMISIVLGLLLVAAASQLLLGGVISSRLQQGAADAQDSGLFGLDYLAKDIRLTNYGNTANLVLNDTTPSGGVVLTATNLTVTPAVANGLLSHSDSDTVGTGSQWTGAKKVTGATTSDQLTIQFTAPAQMSNCEGTTVNAGNLVIQRYFLRADSTDTAALVLACDAGGVSAGALSGFGDAGQVMMQRVEHLRILLGTQAADTSAGSPSVVTPGVWRYYSIHNYVALTTPKPQIKSIQLSVLVRSLDNTNSNVIDPTRSFAMLDQTVTPTENTKRYVRRVYTTTIALRNGLGSP